MINIPLEGTAVNGHQSFSMQLGENACDFELNWNTQAEIWSMDISVEGVSKIRGMILLANCEISLMYNAGIGRFFFVNTAGEDVTLNNLGVANQLVWEVESGE